MSNNSPPVRDVQNVISGGGDEIILRKLRYALVRFQPWIRSIDEPSGALVKSSTSDGINE